jgi:hypothetical protein
VDGASDDRVVVLFKTNMVIYSDRGFEVAELSVMSIKRERRRHPVFRKSQQLVSSLSAAGNNNTGVTAWLDGLKVWERKGRRRSAIPSKVWWASGELLKAPTIEQQCAYGQRLCRA